MREPGPRPFRMFGFPRHEALIADDGVPLLGEMNSNLVAPARFESNVHDRDTFCAAYDFVMCDGELAFRCVGS